MAIVLDGSAGITANSIIAQIVVANSALGSTNQALYSNSTGGIYWSAVPSWTYISSNTTLMAGSYLVDASTQDRMCSSR